ncbi:unnamed protein product [Symbiodinium natans]|uniref:Uncharacterized protein n=1 Tax=Symbiodinium natans TaxID=878477 RepID=A0A812RUK8_9DINO|nr:unnamed protein product [Symbiodinium natans]
MLCISQSAQDASLQRLMIRPGLDPMDPASVFSVLEALQGECQEREEAIKHSQKHLEHLRRLERVALAGADSGRLTQLRQVRGEILYFVQHFSGPHISQIQTSTADGDPSEKSAASLLRDVRHWHSELRRLEWIEASQAKAESERFKGLPLTPLTAELCALHQVLVEQEESRRAAEEHFQQLQHPSRTSPGLLPEAPSACNASVAAGIRLATGASGTRPQPARETCDVRGGAGFSRSLFNDFRLQDGAATSMYFASCT